MLLVFENSVSILTCHYVSYSKTQDNRLFITIALLLILFIWNVYIYLVYNTVIKDYIEQKVVLKIKLNMISLSDILANKLGLFHNNFV